MLELQEKDGAEHEPTPVTDLVHLRELVRRHQICWESRPERAAVDGTARQVGFIVEITATHDHPHPEPVSGCAQCEAPLRALEAVIGFILPKDRRDSVYDVRVPRGALQYDRRRRNRPELRATIAVLHADGADRPVDACEERCRREIVHKLEELGACEGAWASAALGS
jgi:hypothetical protein